MMEAVQSTPKVGRPVTRTAEEKRQRKNEYQLRWYHSHKQLSGQIGRPPLDRTEEEKRQMDYNRKRAYYLAHKEEVAAAQRRRRHTAALNKQLQECC